MKIKAKFDENSSSDALLDTFQSLLVARNEIKQKYNVNYSVKINPLKSQIVLAPSEEIIDFSYQFKKVVIK